MHGVRNTSSPMNNASAQINPGYFVFVGIEFCNKAAALPRLCYIWDSLLGDL
jgi:hypothetical protein